MRILTAHAIHIATTCYVMHERAHKGRNLLTSRDVAVALNFLRFNSLGWSVTPTFFFLDRRFSVIILKRWRKNEQKLNVESLKFSYFSIHATSNPANLGLSGFVYSVA